MAEGGTPARIDVIREFVPHSPFVGRLGARLAALEPDRAVLALPFAPELATMGDVVHGGAIAALIDTAGMPAAWADAETVPESLAGATVSMSVDYVAAARGVDLEATARVIRRGRSLCFCEVDVTDPAGAIVAKGLVAHRYG